VGLTPVIDLGMMPLSDGLRFKHELDQPESRYRLEVAFCPKCSLLQILETVGPGVLYGQNYPYYSSFSEHLLRHSAENARRLKEEAGLGAGSLVVEVASNDGYMLRNFKEWGIGVLGIDPAEGPVRAARELGIETLAELFTHELALALAGQGRQADVLIANNVLAHATDTKDFVRAVAAMLKPGGMASIEFPYVRDLIDHTEFDTIYHEHLCYFSLTAVVRLFRGAGLTVKGVERLAIHGGSLRVTVGHGEGSEDSVAALLEEEREVGLDQAGYYQSFAARVRQLTEDLRGLLNGLLGQGANIAAYGAAAKGAILLNYVGLDHRQIEFVADRNSHKQGKYMPGDHIAIVSPEYLIDTHPDYVLILAWNFKEEIMKQLHSYADAGGKFIVPIPRPRIV
jgi:SAM-dependent methyltransferase